MMGKNRDRVSIIAAILEASSQGASKTRIMFAANLSFKLLEKYLDIVVSAGLVHVQGSTYIATAEGRDFLKKYTNFQHRYKKAQELLEDLGLEHHELARLCAKAGLEPVESMIDE